MDQHEIFALAVTYWDSAIATLSNLSGLITAFATLALAVLTLVLARATKAMAQATSTANVIASLEPNQWSLMHIDLVVQNTGNAPAFDISVKFDPPLEREKAAAGLPLPFANISLLRPGQSIGTFVNEFASFNGRVYSVEVCWRSKANSRKLETNRYQIDLSNLGSVIRLGAANPQVQVAEQIKKLREDWKNVAAGTQKLKVDAYSQRDRDRKSAEEKKMIEEHRRLIQQSNAGSKETPTTE